MPDIYTPNPKKAMEELLEFRSQTSGDYGTGMYSSAITFVNRQKAEENAVTFIDPLSILEPGQPADILEKEIAAQSGLTNHDTVLTGAIGFDSTVANEDAALETTNLRQFLKKLENLNPKPENIIIPISFTKEKHAIMLVLEKTAGASGLSATILDNHDNTNAAEVKARLKTILENSSLIDSNDIIENEVALSSAPADRNDCATFASLIADKALNGQDIYTLVRDANNSKVPFADAATIDDTHKKDIETAQRAYFNYYKNLPGFEKYLESLTPKITLTEFENLDTDKKDQICSSIVLPETNEFTIGEYIDIPADEKWKIRIRPVFEDICAKYNRPYMEFKDKDDPKPLKYKEGNNNVEFLSPNHANIDSNNAQDFILICETAKALGHKSITFGAFKGHPEFKAKLYLACLQTGMGMKNAPANIDELKEYPEYKEIKKEVEKREIRKEMRETRSKLFAAIEARDTDPKYIQLFGEEQAAKNTFDNDNAQKQIVTAEKDKKQKLKDLRAAGTDAEKQRIQAEIKALNDTIDNLKTDADYIAKKDALETARANLISETECPFGYAAEQARLKYEATMNKGLTFALGDTTSADYKKRLDNAKRISERRLEAHPALLKQRAGESNADFLQRKTDIVNALVQRPNEKDTDFQARKDAVINGRLADNLHRKDGESDTDYENRKLALEAKWAAASINPEARARDNKLKERRKITQNILRAAVKNR